MEDKLLNQRLMLQTASLMLQNGAIGLDAYKQLVLDIEEEFKNIEKVIEADEAYEMILQLINKQN